jgi:hypothetical protein
MRSSPEQKLFAAADRFVGHHEESRNMGKKRMQSFA